MSELLFASGSGSWFERKSDLIATRTERDGVIVKRSGGELLRRGGRSTSTTQTCVRRLSENDVRDLYWRRSITRGCVRRDCVDAGWRFGFRGDVGDAT